MFNIVYINTHDSGRYISPYGYKVNTPALQEFAEDATLFSKAYSCAPTCSPSRAAMLTSTMPHKNGVMGLAQRGFEFNDPKQHLAAYMSSVGYDTILCGIQHEVSWYFDVDEKALNDIGYQQILTNSAKKYSKEDYHLWDRSNAETIVKWIKNRDSEEPFMLSYGLHSTHRPYPKTIDGNIDQRYVNPAFPLDKNDLTREDHAKYLTSVQHADASIGLVINALKEQGLYDKSIIIFTTDHGLPLPFHKSNLRDDGIGVSMIFRHPKVGHGKIVDGLVSQIDVFPTLCEILEIDIPEYVEGKSFTRMFIDDKVKIRDEIYAQMNFHTSYEPIRCVRTERYKYVKYYDYEWQKYNLSNMDDAEPKDYLIQQGVQNISKDMEQFFDLEFDPTESNNLIGNNEYIEIIDNLRNRLNKYLIDSDDPIVKGEIEIKKNYKVNKQSCVKASSKNPNDYDPRGRTS